MLSVTYVFTSWVHISVKWFSQCICLVLSNTGTYHCIAIHLKCLNFSLVLTHIPTVISVTLASSQYRIQFNRATWLKHAYFVRFRSFSSFSNFYCNFY